MEHQAAGYCLTPRHIEDFMSSWRVEYEIFLMLVVKALKKVPTLGAAAAIVSLSLN